MTSELEAGKARLAALDGSLRELGGAVQALQAEAAPLDAQVLCAGEVGMRWASWVARLT